MCVLSVVVVWRNGSTLVSINEVNLHQAQLVLGWVTMPGFSSQCWTFILVCNQLPRSTQPGHPFVGRRNEYKPKGGEVLQRGVKAGMVCVWVVGKTVWFPCYTQAISECFEVLFKFMLLYFNTQHTVAKCLVNSAAFHTVQMKCCSCNFMYSFEYTLIYVCTVADRVQLTIDLFLVAPH